MELPSFLTNDAKIARKQHGSDRKCNDQNDEWSYRSSRSSSKKHRRDHSSGALSCSPTSSVSCSYGDMDSDADGDFSSSGVSSLSSTQSSQSTASKTMSSVKKMQRRMSNFFKKDSSNSQTQDDDHYSEGEESFSRNDEDQEDEEELLKDLTEGGESEELLTLMALAVNTFDRTCAVPPQQQHQAINSTSNLSIVSNDLYESEEEELERLAAKNASASRRKRGKRDSKSRRKSRLPSFFKSNSPRDAVVQNEDLGYEINRREVEDDTLSSLGENEQDFIHKFDKTLETATSPSPHHPPQHNPGPPPSSAVYSHPNNESSMHESDLEEEERLSRSSTSRRRSSKRTSTIQKMLKPLSAERRRSSLLGSSKSDNNLRVAGSNNHSMASPTPYHQSYSDRNFRYESEEEEELERSKSSKSSRRGSINVFNNLFKSLKVSQEGRDSDYESDDCAEHNEEDEAKEKWQEDIELFTIAYRQQEERAACYRSANRSRQK